MRLNRTPDPLDRSARNAENENWDIIESLISKLEREIDSLVLENSGDSNAEVVAARGGFRTLGRRLNDIMSQLTEAKNESKEYADGLFNNLDGLQIKGGFDSLQELINAYPNGTEGLFVVGNYLYGWNGSEWKFVKELEVMPWADFMTEQNEEWRI